MNTATKVFYESCLTPNFHLKWKQVEYTYKSSAKEKPVTITLKPFSMLVQNADGEQKIPFVKITSVHLSRRSGELFKAVLAIEDQPNLVVTNRFYISKLEFENRGPAYTTFIRVLHHHLKDKSDAVFVTGISYNSLILTSLIACFAALLITFVAEYFGLMMNPFFLAAAISIAGVTAILVYQKRKLGKQYDPANIPVKFLPNS